MSTATLPAAPALMTAAEFLRLYGGECGVDLVEGRIVRDPMPSPEHGRICGEAYAILREFVKPRDLGRLMTNDTFVRVGNDPDSVRGADVCYISHRRLPKDQPLPTGSFKTPPELVIEVRSPSDRMSAVMKKIDDYIEAGVEVTILLDPAMASATVFRKDSKQQLVNADELTLPDVLPGFAVSVNRFFA